MKYTKAIVDAIHNGELDKAEYEETDTFKLQVPKSVSGVPSDILNPANSWKHKDEYNTTIRKVAEEFIVNYERFKAGSSIKYLEGGPQL